MKLIIDIEKDYYEILKYNVEHEQNYKPWNIITNGIPYEERPQGEWIFMRGVTCGGYYKCNKCGEVERAEKNYCPNCGADMRGKEE